MVHKRIYAVILGLLLCCLVVSAQKPRGEKGGREAGVSILPLDIAKDKKGKKRRWVGVFDREEDLRGKKSKKGIKAEASTLPLNMDKDKKSPKPKFDQKSDQIELNSVGDDAQ